MRFGYTNTSDCRFGYTNTSDCRENKLIVIIFEYEIDCCKFNGYSTVFGIFHLSTNSVDAVLLYNYI